MLELSTSTQKKGWGLSLNGNGRVPEAGGRAWEEGFLEEETLELGSGINRGVLCERRGGKIILGRGRSFELWGNSGCLHDATVHLGYKGIVGEGCGLYLWVTESHVCPYLSALASEPSRVG